MLGFRNKVIQSFKGKTTENEPQVHTTTPNGTRTKTEKRKE